jgi:dipeptidyl aminopeptidase/acylaminoacyl peptidase
MKSHLLTFLSALLREITVFKSLLKVSFTYSVAITALIGLTISGALANELRPSFADIEMTMSHKATLQNEQQTILLSREQAIASSQIRDVSLSPNGQYLAYVKREDIENKSLRQDHLKSLWVRVIDGQTGQKREHKIMTRPKLSDYAWSANNKYLFVFSSRFVSVVSVPDFSKDDSIDRIDIGYANNDLKLNKLTRPKILYQLDPKRDEYFLTVNHHHDNALLIASRDPKSGLHAIDNIDIEGVKTRIFESEHEILDVLTSYEKPNKAAFIKMAIAGQGAIFDARSERLDSQNYHVDSALINCDMHNPCHMLQFNRHTQKLHLLGNFGNDLVGLYEFDANKKESDSVESLPDSSPNLLHQDPRSLFDIDKVYFSDNQPEIVSYATESITYYGLTEPSRIQIEQFSISQNAKAKAAGQKDSFYKLAMNNDLTRWLVTDLSSDSDITQYAIYTPEDRQFELALLSHALSDPSGNSSANPSGNASTTILSQRQGSYRFAFSYMVSDGMQQFGYVTIPKGYDLTKLPLVVMPHGGPWSRSHGDYNKISDFMASRGYAVFEPNFRSSTGMGLNYMTSANKDFGDGIVQQDIIDGMHALLNEGIGDPEQLAMVGHSFGGFATLAGLSFTPNLFTMGFAGAPPSDLVHSIEHLARKDFRNLNIRRESHFSALAVDIKDQQDKERLSLQSPAKSWQSVNKPLYIWAGKHDDRVDIKKVRYYSSKISNKRSTQADNQDFVLFTDPYSGHSPRSELAVEAYLYLIEWSLHKHFKGKFEAETSERLSQYIKANTQLGKQYLQNL